MDTITSGVENVHEALVQARGGGNHTNLCLERDGKTWLCWAERLAAYTPFRRAADRTAANAWTLLHVVEGVGPGEHYTERCKEAVVSALIGDLPDDGHRYDVAAVEGFVCVVCLVVGECLNEDVWSHIEKFVDARLHRGSSPFHHALWHTTKGITTNREERVEYMRAAAHTLSMAGLRYATSWRRIRAVFIDWWFTHASKDQLFESLKTGL